MGLAKPSFGAKRLLSAMSQAEHGSIALRLPDNTWQEFGRGERLAEGKVTRWDVFDKIISRGDVGLAETYIDGTLDIDRPDQMIAWACTNETQLKKAIYGAALSLIFDRIRHLGRRNTVTQAKKNIASHYDLGNEFYSLWLDPTLTYSSALFSSPEQSLQDAQISKYERILNQAGARPGDHILEIGCGWGGFFTHAVKTRGCRVTAITISEKQFETCKKRIEREGLQESVTLVLEDYRKIEGKFDHVVSIEMIEAVGQSYWPTYFDKIYSSLKAGGKAVIQSITIREDLSKRYEASTDFIQQYVFPGGHLPTESAFSKIGRTANLHLSDLCSFPESYERTCRDWRESFKRARKDVAGLGFNAEFMRLWEFYLAYCEGAFRAKRVGVAHFTLEREVSSSLSIL